MQLTMGIMLGSLLVSNDVGEQQVTARWPPLRVTHIPVGAKFFFQEQDGCTESREAHFSVGGVEIPRQQRVGASSIYSFPVGAAGEHISMKFEVFDQVRGIKDERVLTFEDQIIPMPTEAPTLTVDAFRGQLPRCSTSDWYYLEFNRPKDTVGVIIYNHADEPTGLSMLNTKYLVAQRGPCFSAAALNALGQTGPRSDLVCPGGCSGVESKGAQGFGLLGLLGILTRVRRWLG